MTLGEPSVRPTGYHDIGAKIMELVMADEHLKADLENFDCLGVFDFDTETRTVGFPDRINKCLNLVTALNACDNDDDNDVLVPAPLCVVKCSLPFERNDTVSLPEQSTCRVEYRVIHACANGALNRTQVNDKLTIGRNVFISSALLERIQTLQPVTSNDGIPNVGEYLLGQCAEAIFKNGDAFRVPDLVNHATVGTLRTNRMHLTDDHGNRLLDLLLIFMTQTTVLVIDCCGMPRDKPLDVKNASITWRVVHVGDTINFDLHGKNQDTTFSFFHIRTTNVP